MTAATPLRRWITLFPTLIAAVGVALTTGPVRADITPKVVYGNLGSTGASGLGDTSTTTGPSSLEKSLAAGFTTGTDIQTLYIVGITLGIAAPVGDPGNRTLGIYNDDGGKPGSILQHSSTAYVSAKAKYTFLFNWAELSPNTSYWVRPSDPILWYNNVFNSAPNQQNTSGYGRIGTGFAVVQNRDSSGDQWYESGNSTYAISIVAVPEPSAIMILGCGAIFVGVSMSCGRIRKSRHSA